MTELDKLIDAVGAGALLTCNDFYEMLSKNLTIWRLAYKAYEGSLDAAKALHDALLPGWSALIGQNAHHMYWSAWVRFAKDGTIEHERCAPAENPARAWLLAILKAYRATNAT